MHAQACMPAYKHSHTQKQVRLYYLLDLFTRDKGDNEKERASEREQERARMRE